MSSLLHNRILSYLQISHKTNSRSRRRMSSGVVTFSAMDDTFRKELINPFQCKYFLYTYFIIPYFGKCLVLISLSFSLENLIYSTA